MAALRQVQQQRMLQKLSPQQIQLVKLLEVPSIEMTERILKEVDQNPALELGDPFESEQDENFGYDNSDGGTNEDFSLGDYASEDDMPDYRSQLPQGKSTEDWKEWIPVSSNMTLNDFLLDQLSVQELDEDRRKVAEFIVGNVDDDGYLRRNAASISDDLSTILCIDVPEKDIAELIELIQQFEPAGVGAADLKECLLLQLRRKPQTKAIGQTITLLENYFEEFSRKHYESILKKMDCSMEDLKLMTKEVVKLNPKPGNLFGSVMEESKEQVVPDFLLDNNDGILQLSLVNGTVPELHISRGYVEMVNDYKSSAKNQTKETKEALQFAREKVDAARWFIDAVKQRQETMIRTMQAIVDYQYEYFLDGDEKHLKPMILKDVAERTGYDISTISRVSNSKYIQTEFGVFPLKYFFTEGMQTESGEEVSSLEIKTILQQSVDGEDKKNPLTDDQLSTILTGKGYVIARRTIAKYREQLGIPVARLRREI
ncbi:MAG: RNA polymerase factor sigma-54 [Bacteroidota bacterium]|nr:RNA polymerase factor sigma-54 [Bacteroidota bacterium]